jgi:hypothetical protein
MLDLRRTRRFEKPLVLFLQPIGAPLLYHLLYHLRKPPGTEIQSIPVPQYSTSPPHRQAAGLLKHKGYGLSPRAQTGPCSARRLGRLERMSRLNRPAFFAFSTIGSQLNALQPGRRKLPRATCRVGRTSPAGFPALRTPLHWRIYPPSGPLRLSAVRRLVPFIATWQIWIIRALLSLHPERSSLPLARSLGLVTFLAKTVVLRVEFTDLLPKTTDLLLHRLDLRL